MSENVLIVDDESWCRDLAAKALVGETRVIRTAKDGFEALRIAEEWPVDLVVLDLSMPRLSGFEVATRLRASNRTAGVAILCLTGADDSQSRVQALEGGADDFLGKPYTLPELRTRVNLLLQRRGLVNNLQGHLGRLERLGAWKDDFIHMVIHDIGNALAGTVGYMDLALTAPNMDPQAARDVDMAKSCARSLQRLVADLMDLRRLEEGRMPVQKRPFDVRKMIMEETDALRALLMTRRKTLKIEVEEGLPRLCADRGLLGRIVNNLVTNAVKHSGRAQVITVGACHAADGRMALFVDDDGPGISSDVRRRLFEKFATSAPGSAGTGEGGRGLGLAFCKVAIEAHAGTIDAHAREPVGTRFIVELPIGAPEPGVATASAAPQAVEGRRP